MAGVPVKFRCYRCSQLLGVARAKVGSVVACPRCSAELVVPQPDESAGPPSSESGLAASGALDTGVSLDFLDIRPEDIRVEPDYQESSPSSASRSATVVLPVEGSPPFEPGSTPPADGPVVSKATIVSPPPAPANDATTPIPSLIQIDSPRPAPARKAAMAVRSRDLVLPRSVVASWSLFVLFALAASFFAGLLAGHFVWKVH